MNCYFVCLLIVPLMKGMELEPSDSQENDKRSSGSSFIVNVAERKGHLSSFSPSSNRLKPTPSLEALKKISPDGTVPRDLLIVYEKLTQFDKEKKDTVFALLKSLKKGETPPRLDEFLKKNDWLGDCPEINRFLQAAYNKRGDFTDDVIESCLAVAALSSSSPTPTYLSGPVSEQVYSRTPSTFVLQQQLQQQQLQLQQSQLNLATMQLYAKALQQKVKDDSDSSSSVDSVMQKCITPAKIKKIGSWIIVVVSLMASNSALSYFLGGQSSEVCS